MNSWQQKKIEIRTQLTLTLTFTLITLTHRVAALTHASREQGEDKSKQNKCSPLFSNPQFSPGTQDCYFRFCDYYFKLLHPFSRAIFMNKYEMKQLFNKMLLFSFTITHSLHLPYISSYDPVHRYLTFLP